MNTFMEIPGLSIFSNGFALIICLGCCLPSPSHSTFYVIQNTTFPCAQLQAMAPEMQRVSLSDDQKMSVFRDRGGVYIPNYMARTMEEANIQFPSLLDIPKRFKERVLLNKALERVQEERITKEDIASYMRSHRKPAPSDKGDESSTPERRTPLERLFRRRHKRSTSATICDQPELTGYIEDELAPAEEDFPLVLPTDMGMSESIVSTDGSQTNITYCHPRGSYADTSQNTKTLCMVCYATTTLGSNSWPPVLNEALCHPDCMDCLFIEGLAAQGLCRQNTIAITSLCKQEGYCSLALQDGETIIVDEWDSCYQDIRTGCECTVYKNSFLSSFL